MECCLCHEVVHPGCVTDTGVEGYIKSELPNSWECPTCVRNGDAVKPEVKTEEDILGTGATPNKLIKLNNSAQQPNKRAMAYGADSTYTGHQLFQVQGRPDQSKQELRSQLATQILSASTELKKEPQYVFRPPPMQLGAEEIYGMIDCIERLGSSDTENCSCAFHCRAEGARGSRPGNGAGDHVGGFQAPQHHRSEQLRARVQGVDQDRAGSGAVVNREAVAQENYEPLLVPDRAAAAGEAHPRLVRCREAAVDVAFAQDTADTHRVALGPRVQLIRGSFGLGELPHASRAGFELRYQL